MTCYDGPDAPVGQTKTLNARSMFRKRRLGAGWIARLFWHLRRQYGKLLEAAPCEQIVLWFDACLFDQSVLFILCAWDIGTPECGAALCR